MRRIAAAYNLGGRQMDGLEYLRRLEERSYNGVAIIEEQARELYFLNKTSEASLLMEVIPKISSAAWESHPAAIGSAVAPNVRPVPKAAQDVFSSILRPQAALPHSNSC